MVQVPADTRCTVAVLTVQTVGVSEENETVRPDDAVALTSKSGSPYVLLESALKVIVWLACVIVTVPLAPVRV
jgi:hypothetical protein